MIALEGDRRLHVNFNQILYINVYTNESDNIMNPHNAKYMVVLFRSKFGTNSHVLLLK